MSLVTKTIALIDGQSDEQLHAVRQAYQRNPRQMTMLLARQLGVPEALVIRAMPDDLAVELDAARWEGLLRAFEDLGPVHVIVSNGATTIESVGVFGGFSQGGGFFNVQSTSLDMHLRPARFGSVFAVRKPSHTDGHETNSIQFFDLDGVAAFKVFLTFGGSDPAPKKTAQFKALIEEFRLPDSAIISPPEANGV